MKKAIATIAILIAFYGLNAQNARKDAEGNYHALNYPPDSVATGKTYTNAKGEVYPVFSTGKGKLYYGRISAKNGKYYRAFLKLEGEIKNQ